MRPHTLAAFWALLLAVLVSPAAAHAAPARMAVMDLTKGAGSQEYDGLGMALSGMLVSDLVQVEQLALVERQRLDDVVGELKLSEGEFIDPKTAQKLGRGLGADLILVGSYSVVGKTFVLDGRIVDVASGEVKGAGSSTGSIDDFVAVEKDLIDQLIQALNIQLGASAKRKLMLQAQTENFEALSAYGEGLKRKKQGKADDAKAAFQRATQLDPEFAAAKAALSEMRSKVQAHEEALEDWKSKLKADAHRTVLEAFPDESTRPEGFVHDYKSLAQLTLRLIALEQAGLHCQRAKEMRAFLDRMEWKLDAPLVSIEVQRREAEAARRAQLEKTYAHLPPDMRDNLLRQTLEAQRQATPHVVPQAQLNLLGMGKVWNEVQSHEETNLLEAYKKTLLTQPMPAIPGMDYVLMHGETRLLWGQGLAGFAIGHLSVGIEPTLKASLRACLDDGDYIEALEQLTSHVSRSGYADHPAGTGSTVELVLQMEINELNVKTYGATQALQKRIDAMLADHPVGTPYHTNVLAHAKKITQIAQKQGTARRILGDMTMDELTEVVAAVNRRDTNVFPAGATDCKVITSQFKMIAAGVKNATNSNNHMSAAFKEDMIRMQLDSTIPLAAAVKDVGCLADHPSRFKDAATRMAFIEKTMANIRLPPDAPQQCQMSLTMLDSVSTWDINLPVMQYNALQMLYSQAHQGCIEL